MYKRQEVDSAIGDGDHGIGMATGMKNVKEVLLDMEGEKNVYSIFEEAGKAMLLSMGGASGVIFGSLYLEGALGTESKDYLTCLLYTSRRILFLYKQEKLS